MAFKPVVKILLGPLIPALLIINIAAALMQWRTIVSSQKRLIVFSFGSIIIFTFLMTPASAPVWEIVRMPFPVFAKGIFPVVLAW